MAIEPASRYSHSCREPLDRVNVYVCTGESTWDRKEDGWADTRQAAATLGSHLRFFCDRCGGPLDDEEEDWFRRQIPEFREPWMEELDDEEEDE